MSLIKVRKSANEELQILKRIFYCPACKKNHILLDEKRRKWKVSGSIKQPTVTPDYSCKVVNGLIKQLCHLKIENGKIHYYEDCEHSFANKIVDMVDFDTLERE